MTEVDEIAAWLRKQAVADIETAEAAYAGPWHPERAVLAGTGGAWTVSGPDDGLVIISHAPTDADVVHVARHDPRTETDRAASVLEVLGDRERTAAIARPAELPDGWLAGRDYLDAQRELAVLDEVVRVLSKGYRNREGYKPEWADA